MVTTSQSDDRLGQLLHLADICLALSLVLRDRLGVLGSVKSDLGLILVFAFSRLTVIACRLMDYAFWPVAKRQRKARDPRDHCVGHGPARERIGSPVKGLTDEFGILVMTNHLEAKGKALIQRDRHMRFGGVDQEVLIPCDDLETVKTELSQWLQLTDLCTDQLSILAYVPGPKVNVPPPKDGLCVSINAVDTAPGSSPEGKAIYCCLSGSPVLPGPLGCLNPYSQWRGLLAIADKLAHIFGEFFQRRPVDIHHMPRLIIGQGYPVGVKARLVKGQFRGKKRRCVVVIAIGCKDPQIFVLTHGPLQIGRNVQE